MDEEVRFFFHCRFTEHLIFCEVTCVLNRNSLVQTVVKTNGFISKNDSCTAHAWKEGENFKGIISAICWFRFSIHLKRIFGGSDMLFFSNGKHKEYSIIISFAENKTTQRQLERTLSAFLRTNIKWILKIGQFFDPFIRTLMECRKSKPFILKMNVFFILRSATICSFLNEVFVNLFSSIKNNSDLLLKSFCWHTLSEICSKIG